MPRTTFKIVQSLQLLFPFISLALAASILGLSSDILAFTHKHRHDRVGVRDNTGWFAYFVHLPYLPQNFSLTRPILLLLTGLFSVLLNATVLVLLVKKRKVNVSENGAKSHNFRPGALVIACDALALLFTLAITIYAWHSMHLFPGNNSKPINGPLKSHNGVDVHWDEETHFDPINWNCVVYPFVHRQLHEPIKKACQEGLALVDLTVPLLILECATFCVHFWFWRPNKMNEIEETDATKTGSESYRMDDFGRTNVNVADQTQLN